ncbi:MAG: hypothetical protein RLP02_17695 [Coleofasciculus sp. C2-GNP5-27]|jgi:hypothetical protein|uniref:hypothetical protein n=1 Tax=Coleofasciculus sp. C1-SOL-03 TaxID=3069522 RepID=UPI0032F4E803
MADRTTTKNKSTQTETQQALARRTPNTTVLDVKPLPNNRPIAPNSTESSDELMGYLD